MWTLIGPNGEEARFEHEPRLAASDFDLLHSAALRGVGVAFLPEMYSKTAVAEGALVHVLSDWHSREDILHLVFTSRRGMLPSVRAVIDFIAHSMGVEIQSWESATAAK